MSHTSTAGWESDTEAELFRRARSGDGRAFADLMRLHRRIIDAACTTAVADPTAREDAVQHALVDIWKGLDTFRGDSQFSTWLYRVAQNAARRELRRTLRVVDITRAGSADGPTPAEDAPGRSDGWSDAFATRSIVVDAVASLSGDHRDALVLHTQAGLPLQEIADLKGVALGTVKAWLHRARAEVARALDAADSISPDDGTTR